MDTNLRSAIAETAITAHAVRLGIEVYVPAAGAGRVDLVFLWPDGHLSRIQCKWAVRTGDVVMIRPYTSARGPNGLVRRRYGPDEVDAIAGYCAENDTVYLVPIDEIARRWAFSMRLAPARNNQRLGVHWAAQYELGAIAQLGERRAGSAKVAGSSPASSTS